MSRFKSLNRRELSPSSLKIVGFHFPAMIPMAVVTGHSDILSIITSVMSTYLFVSHASRRTARYLSAHSINPAERLICAALLVFYGGARSTRLTVRIALRAEIGARR
jgi:hypothetical protein